MEKNAEKSRESEADVAEESVFQALAEFNKWHGAEAVAEIIKLEGPSITVELSGPFCKTCGFYDYFDDLKIEIEKVLSKSLEIAQVSGGGDVLMSCTGSKKDGARNKNSGQWAKKIKNNWK